MNETVCIVEDDANISEIESFALKSAGLNPFTFETGKELFESIHGKKPSLIILDIMLPGEDGIEILKKLKLSFDYSSIPVIMVSAKSSEIEKVKCLDIGADDYITKPFGVMELSARVKAVLRRSGPEKADTIISGPIVLDLSKRKAFANGESVELTYKEFELLKLLCENEGRVISREIIMDSVWGENFIGESRTIDMHVKTLRQKLKEASSGIKTVRNIGYKADWT